jgi:hypothetical protein
LYYSGAGGVVEKEVLKIKQTKWFLLIKRKGIYLKF